MLVDSEPIAVRIDVEMLAEVGVTMSEAEVIERYVGRSPQVIVAETEATIGRRVPDGWFERGEARIREAYATELRPVAGMAEALAAIDDPVCVASSSGHESIRYKLELTGLYERFAGTDLQRHRGGQRQAGPRPVPARRRADGRRTGRAAWSSRTAATGCRRRGRRGWTRSDTRAGSPRRTPSRVRGP